MALFFPCILRGSATQKLNLPLGGHQAKRLKDDAVKVLKSICQQVWKTQQWLQDWKRSVLIQIPKKDNAKKCSNYSQCTHFTCEQSNAQILQAWLQQYMNRELPDVQAGFRKGRGTSVLAWRISGTGEPLGLPSMRLHRVGHD